jgi:hypothetical protein
MSIELPFFISRQLSHLLQGSTPSGRKQFIAIEKILAADVLPAPFGPENKKDWGISSDFNILIRLFETESESKSSNLFGRYFKWKTGIRSLYQNP